MSEVSIEGTMIHSEADLHRLLEAQFEFGDFYGRNLAALRDRLLTDVPRPVLLIWRDSGVSREYLGEELFIRVTNVLDEAVQQDIEFGFEDRFQYLLE